MPYIPLNDRVGCGYNSLDGWRVLSPVAAALRVAGSPLVTGVVAGALRYWLNGDPDPLYAAASDMADGLEDDDHVAMMLGVLLLSVGRADEDRPTALEWASPDMAADFVERLVQVAATVPPCPPVEAWRGRDLVALGPVLLLGLRERHIDADSLMRRLAMMPKVEVARWVAAEKPKEDRELIIQMLPTLAQYRRIWEQSPAGMLADNAEA